jgi:hypothetical protein
MQEADKMEIYDRADKIVISLYCDMTISKYFKLMIHQKHLFIFLMCKFKIK